MKRIWLLLAVCSLLMTVLTVEVVPNKDNAQMFEIAKKVEHAFQVIDDEKDRLGINNTHYSGMIGSEYTGLTTTLGSYESKTTSTNPNFSSVIYNYLKKMQLTSGDVVALNLSSSFPALNIQTIMTVESMGIQPIIISSIGASTFGATDEAMTYLDMEMLLYEKGLIQSKSVLISSGGDDDLGTNMDQAVLARVIERLVSKGYSFYREEDYKKNIDTRMKLYEGAAALVNVGGNYVSHTENDIGYFDDNGLIEPSGYNYTKKGLIGMFLSQNKAVLHLLNIKDLAMKHHLPIDPTTTTIGEGGAFTKTHYSIVWISVSMVFIILLVLEMNHDQRKKRKEILYDLVEQELMD